MAGAFARVGCAYTASKHGTIGLTKAAALEYAQAGIRVNAVCPSWIETPLTTPATTTNPQLKAQIVARQPGGRLGTPEQVANAVAWLASDAASFVTGTPCQSTAASRRNEGRASYAGR